MDRILIPEAFMARDAGVKEIAGRSMAMAEWTQTPAGGMARGSWQKISVDTAEARLQAIMNDLKFSQEKDSFAVLRTVKSPFSDIGSVVANTRLAGKDTIVRIARGSSDTFVRVAPSVPWRSREGIRKLLDGGLKTQAEKDKLQSILDKGRRDGWLRTGQSLDSVAVSANSPSRIAISAEKREYADDANISPPVGKEQYHNHLTPNIGVE
ncbi:MAG: hypothetical protein R6W94_10635 [Spirochaetia bacterium]